MVADVSESELHVLDHAPLGIFEVLACGTLGHRRIAGGNGVKDGLMLCLDRLDEVGVTCLGVAAQVPDHFAGGVFEMLAQREEVGIVGGDDDGLVELVILLVASGSMAIL